MLNSADTLVPDIDVSTLARVLALDVDGTLIAEVVSCYVTDAKANVEAVVQMGLLNQVPDAVRLLHTLKSSSGCVGAARVAQLAGTLEDRARRSGALPTRHELDRLTAKVDAACRQLHSLHPSTVACEQAP